MNYMKHCDLLRQTCPEPMACGNGCQCAKKDASDMPVVDFNGAYQWLWNVLHLGVYAIGLVTIVCLAIMAAVNFYARFV